MATARKASDRRFGANALKGLQISFLESTLAYSGHMIELPPLRPDQKAPEPLDRVQLSDEGLPSSLYDHRINLRYWAVVFLGGAALWAVFLKLI